jgi:fermentation-respiration switch protein FrsA (DUF1100 family)
VVLLPSSFFGAFEAVSRRLVDAPVGTELKAYVLPQGETSIKLQSSVTERIQIGNEVFDVWHFEAIWEVPAPAALGLSITSTKDGGLVRFSVPSQGLDVVRADVAASTSRTQVYSNPGDEAVTIPVTGFNLGATLTRPPAAAAGAPDARRHPARGLGQQRSRRGRPRRADAGAPGRRRIARAGYLAVRYDKRGFGQSGGRAESATLTDYAGRRPRCGPLARRSQGRRYEAHRRGRPRRRRVGGAARRRQGAQARSRRVAGGARHERRRPGPRAAAAVAGTVHSLTAGPRRTRRSAEADSLGRADGEGWESVPPNLRKEADTPWMQSFLIFDPAKTIEDVRQPILFVHGALDHQVPPSNAERLVELART